MRIGSYNRIDIGSTIDTSNVGDYNIFEARSSISDGSKVGDNCIVLAGIV